MEEEWQHYLQSIFIGLIFSYLLAKLISIVISFKDENLTLTRTESEPFIPTRDDLTSPLLNDEKKEGGGSSSSITEKDDDDWEGVETTELDEAFVAATTFVATAAADGSSSSKVSSDVQLRLYGFYKIATEGPCSTPQPSALKMTARAKWQAWQKLGTMPPEDAMQKYIELVTELYPTWIAGSTNEKSKDQETDKQRGEAKGPMGPVFSSLIYEEESENEFEMDAIHVFAREGEAEKLLKCLDSGVPVNVKDSEDRTALHWAVDRGHFNIIELLIRKNADVNAKDNEGQTPLHYAATCDREAIAEFLLKHNANINAKDNDGNSPNELCDTKWSWMLSSSSNQIN